MWYTPRKPQPANEMFHVVSRGNIAAAPGSGSASGRSCCESSSESPPAGSSFVLLRGCPGIGVGPGALQRPRLPPRTRLLSAKLGGGQVRQKLFPWKAKVAHRRDHESRRRDLSCPCRPGHPTRCQRSLCPRAPLPRRPSQGPWHGGGLRGALGHCGLVPPEGPWRRAWLPNCGPPFCPRHGEGSWALQLERLGLRVLGWASPLTLLRPPPGRDVYGTQ